MEVIEPTTANTMRATCFWDQEDSEGYFCNVVVNSYIDGVYEVHGTGYWKDADDAALK